MSSGKARHACVFVAGFTLGALALLGLLAHTDRIEVDRDNARVQRVRGVERRHDLDRQYDLGRRDGMKSRPDAAARPGVTQSSDAIPKALDRQPTNSTPLTRLGEAQPSAREVARRARDVTAFVHGNGVYGAGIVIGRDSVLTCLHVVREMKTIHVSLADGNDRTSDHAAQLVDQDAKLDLAVLTVDLPPSERVGAAHLGSISTVQVGDTVYAMGAPRKLHFSLSRGLVSYRERVYDGVAYLQTDLATNGGSSGGPVLDERGRVVAVSSFILKGSQGLSFALPIDQARRRFAKYFDES